MKTTHTQTAHIYLSDLAGGGEQERDSSFLSRLIAGPFFLALTFLGLTCLSVPLALAQEGGKKMSDPEAWFQSLSPLKVKSGII